MTTTLPVGTNSVRFEARDTHDSSARADGGSVTIGPAPTPIPEPTPTPTAAPTPRPEPTSAPAHAAGPTEPSATPAPPLAATQVPPRSGEAGSSPTASDIPAGGTAGGGSTTGSGSAAPGGSGSATPGGSGSATPGGSGTADGGANTNPLTWLSGSIGAQFAALGLQGPGHLPTIPAVLGSTIAVGTWMAFMFFKGRRRDDDLLPPGPVLQAAAAAGLGVAPGSGYVPQLDPESLMPRWRRPSLIEARKTDPIRKPAPAQPALSFAREYGTAASGEGTASGPERRRVRYAVTPILDRPDELLGTRIGELAGGDEVQVEGRRGAYCDVVSPDGCRGWVHRTTLGDIVPGIRTFENSGPDPEAVNALAALLSARGFSR